MARKVLEAATGTGLGDSVTYRKAPLTWTIQIKHTGSPTSVILDIEGSINGVDYVQIVQHTVAASDDMFHISGKSITSIRPNVTTLSGGTSPTVSVWLSASEYL